MFAELFSIIAPVLVCAGIGYGWARFGRTFDVEFVTTLITNVATPCLVFHTLANLTVDAAAVGVISGAAVVMLALCAAIAALVLRLSGLSLRAFLPALTFPNTGNMGLPLCFLAFGDAGLALAIGVFAVCAVAQLTIGAAIASGTLSFRNLARIPIVYAVAIAMVFLAAGAQPPAWINATTKLLGAITIPMMLITLGVSLSRLSVRRAGRAAWLSALRLDMGFAVGVLVAWSLGLEGAARGVMVLQSTMPVAVFNFLFAQRYQTAPEEVAGMVVLSTVLSFVSLPLLLIYVL